MGSLLNLPLSQFMQDENPTASFENLPSPQGSQAVDLFLSVNFPARQSLQDFLSVLSSVNLPVSQSVQKDAPFTALNFPAAH
jgi:hypothetical protein